MPASGCLPLAVVIVSGIMAERLAGGNAAIALLANTLATVAGLYILIEVFAPLSGAHFNPAVSLVMARRGALAWSLLVGKRLQLLKETFPRIARVAFLSDERDSSEELSRAAGTLGIALVPVMAQRVEDLVGAVAAGKHADAWFITDHALYFAQRRTIVEHIAMQRKPAIYGATVYVEAGGLMSYGSDLEHQFRRAADLVDKILRGAKPAELPVEQPTKFEFVINLKTAKALGITIPRSVLLRADDVIQ